MTKSLKKIKPNRKIFFNASVILAGLRSPQGGSGLLLKHVQTGEIEGVISEIILDEAIGHSEKIGKTNKEVSKFCLNTFPQILPAPNEISVKKYLKIVKDEGDAHVLASCHSTKAKYLATLDKAHLLVLKGKIKGLKILTPGSLFKIIKKTATDQ